MEPPIIPFDSPDEQLDPTARTQDAAFGGGMSAAPEPGAPNVLASLEAGLASSIEGLTILDRELAFDGLGRVDFAGIDGANRLVLVLLLDDNADVASLEALDLAVIARDHSDLIARHLGVHETARGTTPRCVLVAESIDSRLSRRLELLREGFEMFELQSLVSLRGSQTYLVPATLVEQPDAPQLEPPAEAISPEDFLVTLDAGPREAAEVLLARMQRMDSEFDVLFTSAGAQWAFNGREFLRVERRSERLIGRVLPDGRPAVLDDVATVEGIVEEAFSAYVRLLGLFDDNEDVYDVPGPASEPLLSAEEIAAFQE